MRSQDDCAQRWARTMQQSSTLSALQDSVKRPLENNICSSGLRSVCWKSFLLFGDAKLEKWWSITRDTRVAYSALKDHFLKYVNQPELLQNAVDPLNDDENSPWAVLRRDEGLRAEILQDVERCMPDEPYFRQEATQKLLTDILFIYCKLNQDIGYRQGMHEILAPILWVVDKDALSKPISEDSQASTDLMHELLDANYIEHDSFALFSLIMRTGKSFYELGEAGNPQSAGSLEPTLSPIVERSRRIHEVMLARFDPELASHLTQVEILPQIFLIRWIRLLFGREFPFEDLLPLWDLLFAEDPNLELIDYVCVAMLLRIRWQLLEADYSHALMLLLKYPSPGRSNEPRTFVKDALLLKRNGPSVAPALIAKYSGKAPEPVSTTPRPSVISRQSSQASTSENLLSARRSPLPSPTSFLNQQGGMEAVLKGAAKDVFQRGERLGINQAVRDAVGDIKKNMLTLSPSPSLSRRASENHAWKIDDRRPAASAGRALVALEARNKRLAELLSEVTDELYGVSKTNGPSDEAAKTMSMVIRKLSLIKSYLNDSKLPIPRVESHRQASKPQVDGAEDISGTTTLTNSTTEHLQDPGSFDLQDDEDEVADEEGGLEMTRSQSPTKGPQISLLPEPSIISVGQGDGSTSPTSPVRTDPPTIIEPPSVRKAEVAPVRPPATIPTRYALAQSSFAWMLEPGEEPHSSQAREASPFASSGKKLMPKRAREKSAFLFEDESAGDSTDPLVGEGFSLRTIRK